MVTSAPSCGKGQRDLAADAPGTPGDQCRLAIQCLIRHHEVGCQVDANLI